MNGGTNIHLPTILSYCLCPRVLTRSRVFLSNLPNLYQTCLYQTYLCKTYLHPTLLYQTHLDQIGFYPHSIHPFFLYETCPYQTYLFQTQLQILSKSTLSNFSSSNLACLSFFPVISFYRYVLTRILQPRRRSQHLSGSGLLSFSEVKKSGWI